MNWNWTDFYPELTDPFQIRSSFLEKDLDPIKIQKKMECDPDLELLRSVPDHVWGRGTLIPIPQNEMYLIPSNWNVPYSNAKKLSFS